MIGISLENVTLHAIQSVANLMNFVNGDVCGCHLVKGHENLNLVNLVVVQIQLNKVVLVHLVH